MKLEDMNRTPDFQLYVEDAQEYMDFWFNNSTELMYYKLTSTGPNYSILSETKIVDNIAYFRHPGCDWKKWEEKYQSDIVLKHTKAVNEIHDVLLGEK